MSRREHGSGEPRVRPSTDSRRVGDLVSLNSTYTNSFAQSRPDNTAAQAGSVVAASARLAQRRQSDLDLAFLRPAGRTAAVEPIDPVPIAPRVARGASARQRLGLRRRERVVRSGTAPAGPRSRRSGWSTIDPRVGGVEERCGSCCGRSGPCTGRASGAASRGPRTPGRRASCPAARPRPAGCRGSPRPPAAGGSCGRTGGCPGRPGASPARALLDCWYAAESMISRCIALIDQPVLARTGSASQSSNSG